MGNPQCAFNVSNRPTGRDLTKANVKQPVFVPSARKALGTRFIVSLRCWIIEVFDTYST